MLHDHDGQRHDQMQHSVTDISCISCTVSSTAWQNLKIYGKNKDQDQSHPELRNTAGYGSQLTQDPVCQPVFVPGTQDSQEQGSGKHNDKSDSSKYKCIANTAADHFYHILFIFK